MIAIANTEADAALINRKYIVGLLPRDRAPFEVRVIGGEGRPLNAVS
jgi:hypothetical protein